MEEEVVFNNVVLVATKMKTVKFLQKYVVAVIAIIRI